MVVALIGCVYTDMHSMSHYAISINLIVLTVCQLFEEVDVKMYHLWADTNGPQNINMLTPMFSHLFCLLMIYLMLFSAFNHHLPPSLYLLYASLSWAMVPFLSHLFLMHFFSCPFHKVGGLLSWFVSSKYKCCDSSRAPLRGTVYLNFKLLINSSSALSFVRGATRHSGPPPISPREVADFVLWSHYCHEFHEKTK